MIDWQCITLKKRAFAGRLSFLKADKGTDTGSLIFTLNRYPFKKHSQILYKASTKKGALLPPAKGEIV